MIDVLVAAILGNLLGIVAGLLPGVGVSTIVLSMYIVLLSFDITQILVFYFCLLSSAQYFGSIPAIFLGLAGEASSYPAVIEGHTLAKRGQGLTAIFQTGVGSLVGSLVGLSVLLIAGQLLGTQLAMSTGTMLLVLLTIGIAVCATSNNKWWVDLLLVIVAILFSHIGLDVNGSVPYVNFGFAWLADGISYIALASAMISAKEVMFVKLVIDPTISTVQTKLINPIAELVKLKWSIVRGSLVGSLGGLVPGITTIASSHYAYVLEKILLKDYEKGNKPALVSSETANNAGAITSLLPLLVIGIPITFSEAIIFSILDSKNWTFSTSLPLELFLEQWYIFISVNILSLILAIKGAPYLIRFFPKTKTSLSIFVFVVLITVVYYSGELTYGSGIFDVTVFLLAILVVAVTPSVNYLPFIFWVVIGHNLIETFYRYIQLMGWYQ